MITAIVRYYHHAYGRNVGAAIHVAVDILTTDYWPCLGVHCVALVASPLLVCCCYFPTPPLTHSIPHYIAHYTSN
jgi:hypothetical protein